MAEPSQLPPTRLPEHVTTPLLTLITARSLDADYEHVAARRRAAGEQPATGRTVPRRTAGLVLLAFGLLVTVAAVQTSRNASADNASRASLIHQIDLRRDSVQRLQHQLAREQSAHLRLQRSLTHANTQVDVAQARLQRLQTRTGLTAVRGPGIEATVDDPVDAGPNDLVRDSDLAVLANGLWAAGAEAISVNGQRLTVLSSFRNVGIGILVNSRPVNPPYVFSVIGNPDTLPADLLSSSAGEQWYALKDSLGIRFQVENGGTMSLPAAPAQGLRSARVATSRDLGDQTRGDTGTQDGGGS